MSRRNDWQLRLAAFASERAVERFAWGSNDCSLFAADAVLAMTGIDHARGLRGHASALAALRVVESRGGLHAIAVEKLGASVPPLMAAVGDVVLLVNEGRELLGICNGTTAISPGEDGMVSLDMNTAVAAWKI